MFGEAAVFLLEHFRLYSWEEGVEMVLKQILSGLLLLFFPFLFFKILKRIQSLIYQMALS